MNTLSLGITGRSGITSEDEEARPRKVRAQKKKTKKRPGRREMVRRKRQASAMATVEELATALGIGRNQAYELVKTGKVPAMRFVRRWLIPRAVIARMVSGETAAQT